MPDEAISEVGAGWAPLGVLLLLALATLAASLHAVLAPRTSPAGRRWAFAAPLLDTARLMRQRRRSTAKSDQLLWRTGSILLVLAPVLMIAVIPLGQWTLADLTIGVVWFNAMDVLVWAAVWMLGWGANAAYSLVGGYRMLATALGYELPLMFALTAPAIAAESLRVGDIINAQSQLWFVAWMPIAFVVFCLGVLGFSVRGPLATATATDLSGGVVSELTGPDRLLVLVARHALLVAGAAFATVMFLGGGAGPLLSPPVWLLLKTITLVAIFAWMSPRMVLLRPDRFTTIAWVVVLPLTVLQVLVVSIVVVVRA